MSNLLSKKLGAEIKYYYFDFYQSNAGRSIFFIKKLVDIYNSFNAQKGLIEYDFEYSRKDLQEFSKEFKKIKTKKNLVDYKYHGLKIGELIYDSYIRTTLEPTVNLIDVNEPPQIENALREVEENCVPNETVGVPLDAYDVDEGDVLHFSIIGGNEDAMFKINSATFCELKFLK